MRNLKNKNIKGFTIIEMVVATSIFIMVMVVASGAIMSITDANRKSQSSKVAIDNLSFALENMSRHIRVGSSYSCSDDPDDKSNCIYSLGSGTGGNIFSFKFKDPNSDDPPYTISYKFEGGAVKIKNGNADWDSLTSPEIVIDDEYSRFYVEGAKSSDNKQPRVIITVKGNTSDINPKYQSVFSLQTSLTKRGLDD